MRGASVSMLAQCAGVLLVLLRPAAAGASDDGEWVRAHQSGASRRRDVVLQTVCEAKCWRHVNLHQCTKSCYSKNWEKPGACPSLIQIDDDSASSNQTSFYLPCMNECKKDTDCSGTRKCCTHHCGSTCQLAQNLHDATGLPPIPTEIRAKPRKKKALLIKWKPSLPCDNQALFYIVEQRQQFGKFDGDLLNLQLAEWTTCLRTGRPSTLLKNFVRPGRWYQFRVASVNENGTRGFSQPVTYTAQLDAKPSKAPEVTVGPLRLQNGSLSTELHWIPPKTEATIVKFKVFWSKRLYGISALDSVLVLQHSVPGDANKYVIHDLEPDSMYFIQVQAVAQLGKDILRGEKSGYVLNTTNYINSTDVSNTSNLTICKIDNLQLERLYWSKDDNDLKARFTWKAHGPNVRFNITWWGSCKHKASQHKLTATTRHSRFDVYDLHFDCRYKVNVKETHRARRGRAESGEEHLHLHKRTFYETSVTFTTPSCKDLQPRYRRLKCKHR